MGSPWEWNEESLIYLYVELRWTAKAIAEEWGIPCGTVVKKIRDMGINRGQGNWDRVATEDDPVLVANLAQRYVDAGMTVTEIAAEIGLGTKKVSNVLHRAGVEFRAPAHRGGARDQSGAHNNNWRGGPGVRPCDRRTA